MSDDDLTTAYMVGFHKRDDEVAALKAEIERLRQETLAQSEAIETLRGLLRGWRDAAEIAQDITFAPIAKETDEKLPGLRWSLRF